MGVEEWKKWWRGRGVGRCVDGREEEETREDKGFEVEILG